MHRILWWLLCINLWGFALLGSVFTALGILGYATGKTYGRRMLGQSVDTPEENFTWLVLSLAFACLGWIWVYLQRSGRVSFNPEAR